MGKTAKVLIGVLVVMVAVIVIALTWFVSTNNSLVKLDEAVNTAWAQIETQLQRRFDLIPNLVNTVKGYAKHESDVLTAVTEARARVGSAQTVGDKMSANGELTSALGRLMVVMENYPQLKADRSFLDLQAQLEGTENRIAVARTRYNETVQQYNQAIRRIPDSIIANMRGFARKQLFETVAEARNAPEVKF
jgi:LemA protein